MYRLLLTPNMCKATDIMTFWLSRPLYMYQLSFYHTNKDIYNFRAAALHTRALVISESANKILLAEMVNGHNFKVI